jgi:hypothetical protein
MLRAIYVRTLKPGITDEQFVAAWMPEQHTRSSYPAAVTLARSLVNPRQVLSVFDVDVEPERFADVLPDLVHPDSEDRLAEFVESTELADVYVVSDQFGAGAAAHDHPF